VAKSRTAAARDIGNFDEPFRCIGDMFLVQGKQDIFNTSAGIPPAGQRSFAVPLDKPGSQETVACMGADRELGLKLPAKLGAEDLPALPVAGSDEVTGQFHNIQGAQVDDARLTVEVMR
jgi:hypothetical protein